MSSLQFTDPTPRVSSAFRQMVRNGRTGPGLLQHESDLATPSAPQEPSFVVSELVADYFRKPDPGRLPRIASVIEEYANRKNALGILADCLELCGASATESAIGDMVTQLKLKPRSAATFYAALCYSTNLEVRTLGRRLLAGFVKTSPRFNHFVATIDSQATLQQVATIAVESDQRIFDKKEVTAPLSTMRAQVEFKLPADSMAATNKGKLLAKQLCELGPICVCTLDDAKVLVDLHPGINEADVARAICVMATGKTMPSITPINNATPLWNIMKASQQGASSTVPAWQAIANAIPAASSHADPNVSTNEWNVGNFALAIKEKRPDLVWNNVVRALDQYNLIRSDDVPNVAANSICTATAALETMTVAYRKVSAGGNLLPFECFLGGWSNAHAQWALLQAIIKNPELVDRRQTGNSQLLADVLLNAAAAQQGSGFCPLWRVLDFAAAIVDCLDGVSVRNDVMAFINSAMKTTPAVVICALATCRPTRSVSGLNVLRSLLDVPGVLSSALNPDVVQCIEQARALPFLLTVLGDILTRDSGRLASLISVISSRRLFGALLNHVSDPRVWALVAISGVESNELNNAIFNEMVQKESRPLAARALSATGIVEVCDELLSKNSNFSSCIRAALSSVANASALTSMIPSVINQAEALLNSDCRAIVADDGNFPKEIEEAASRFIESVCRNTVNEDNAIGTCLNLSRSSETKELQLLGCIIFTMLEESRCVGEYPTPERRRFSTLFGHLIDQGLLPKAQLQKALLNILQALLPQNGSDGKSIDPKLQDFAATALMIFKRRLHEWPALAKQIREIQNIDMLVPGIIALLDRPAQQQQRAGEDGDDEANKDGKSGGDNNNKNAEFAISGLHQHDIRILMNKKDKDWEMPNSVVQDRINFLVSNTDPNNLKDNAAELADLVKPQFYTYFADYMIIRRVSLEQNNHKMYINLLQMFDSPQLDTNMRIATIRACKRVIASDSVRNASNERSLLKALGSWLGLTTLARNIPILARELDLTELVPKGIIEGKLIAVVPFVSRVLEAAAQSRAFAVPNPWLLGILSQLVEMYQLPELKITLRFEVEVLCRNLSVSIEAIADYMKANPRRWNLIELKNRYVDVNNSFDFKPSQDDQFVSKKLTPDAPEFRPRGATGGQSPQQSNQNVAQMLQQAGGFNNNNQQGNNAMQGMNMQQNLGNNNMMNSGNAMNNQQQQQGPQQQGGMANNQQQNQQQNYQARVEIRPPQEFMQNVAPNIRDSLRQMLQQAGEAAFREVMQAAERPMAIAMVCAHDIALKDFCHDTDHNALITAAKIMARSLTTHLISVSLRDIMINAIKKNSASVLSRLGVQDQAQLTNEAENFARENVDRFAAVIDEATAEAAQRHVTDFLTQKIEDRNKMLQQQGHLANALPPHVDTRPPNLPDHLRPKGTLGNTHRQIFEDFRGMLGTLRNPRDQIQSILRDVEADAHRHYQVQPPAPATILSLTKPEFTSQILSEYHYSIRQKVVDITKMVEMTADYNLQLTIDTTFKSLVRYSESPVMRRQIQQNDAQSVLQYAITQLLMEICLFTLQKLRDKFQNRVPLEITRLFFAHERRWQLREAATSIGRLALFDFAEFDKELAAALREIAATSHSADRSPAVEFTSHFLQRILIESKSASSNDLQHTLVELQKIAAAKQPTGVRIPSIFGHDDAGRKTRGDLEQVFREWLEICEKRNTDANLSQPSETRQKPVLAYIQKLQSLGLLKVDRGSDTALERFFSALTEIVVEDYATQLMLAERENMNNNSQQQNAANGPKPRAPTREAKLFASADAFSDLVSVLVKCCTWSSGQSSKISQSPEVALVSKVLTVIAKVLKHNHNFFVEEKRPQIQLQEGCVLQDSFMQQPYLRILSNLIMHLGPQHAAAASSSSSSNTDADKERKDKEAAASQTVIEFFSVIASTLHNSLNPSQVPGFAFAWVELLCHRIFVARLLASNPRGWEAYFSMLSDAVKFADQLAQQSQATQSSMLFYRCLLKILVLLLHDFPDFLLLYHQPLCDIIPSGWVQLRNVVLSAFPKNIKLPDPFSASLQLDQLPEINQSPPLLDYHRDCFKDSALTRAQVDAFMNGETGGNSSKQQKGGPRSGRNTNGNNAEEFLTPALIQKLRNPQTGKWNVPLINGLVLYVGLVQAEKRQQQQQAANTTKTSSPTNKPDAYWTITDTPALEVLTFLISQLGSNELRSIVINACANQLRFPNNHTHFFSMALLQLYQYSQHEQQEQVQEIIIRVLLERIVIVRPQPWGLLITFFELVKSPVYDLQNKSFIRCSPEIERTFEGIFDRLVNAPAAQQQQQQQQQKQ